MTLRDLITARQIVDATDVVALFEDWILPRRADGTVEVRGRRRVLSVRTLLLAMAATAIDGREMHIVRLTKTINSWTEKQREALKIPETEASKLPSITHRQVSELWNQIADQVTASEHFASPKLPAGLSKSKKEDLLAARHERLQQVCDLILDGSIAASPDDTGPLRPDPAWETGHYVVDWTYFESWARRRESDAPSTDPDASWISIPGHGYQAKWHLVGYKVHALVRTRTPKGDRVPYVVERLALDHASSQSKEPVLDMIRRMNPLTPEELPSAQQRVLELVADRGYTQNGAEVWAEPLRKLGVRRVMDLTQQQMGSQGITEDGVKAVNGCMTCPAIPEKLINQARIEDFETVEDREAKFDVVEKVRLYEMVPHQKNPDPVTGDQRFTCPARAGKVRCVNFEPSMKVPAGKLPTIYPDASLQADPPKVCTQQTVTIRGSFAIDVRQPNLWGSEDWFDAYDRRTPNVESSFGNLRQPGKQHMARGRIMVMGRAKVSLLLTFQVAAMNVRLTDAYLRTSVKKVSSRVRKKTNGQPVVRRRRAVSYAARKPTSAAQKRARGRSSPQPATAI